MIEIRAATLPDSAEILALQKLCYQSEAELTGDFQIPPLLQNQQSIEADFTHHLYLKAVLDGRIVGAVRACDKGGTCHIGRLIVHPEMQNQGLGRLLMARIEATFPEAIRFELFTGEKSARNIYLYGKLGYRVFRSERRSALTLVFMEKLR